MAKTLLKIFSLPTLMASPRPKALLADELVKLLKKRLKELKIVWNPEIFKKGFSNPKIPKWLLAKLENLLLIAEASNWKISNALVLELDETIEDIESFNPTFRASLKKERRDALKDIRLGRAVSIEKIKKELSSR